MSYGVELITPPATEPVGLQDVRRHLRISHNADDEWIATVLIPSARQRIEARLNRQLVLAVRRLSLDRFPARYFWYAREYARQDYYKIDIPFAPLQGVNEIRYVDPDGAEVVLPAAEYRTIATREPGYVVPAFGLTWPQIRCVPDAVRITYTCGYGLAQHVPAGIKHMILLACGHWYEWREEIVTGTILAAIPDTVEALAAQWSVGDEFACYGV